MASIEPKVGGGYAVRWREGRTARQQTVATKRDAERIKREVERALSEGRRWDPRAALRAPLLGDTAEEGLGIVSRFLAHNADVRGLRPVTIRSQFNTLTPWLVWLGTRLRRQPDLGDLTLGMLEEWLSARRASGVTARTAVVAVRHVEALWRWCWGRPDLRPHTPEPWRVEVDTPHAEQRPYVVNWADLDAMLTVARARCGEGDPAAGGRKIATWPAWRVLAIQRFTGLRIWQAARLRWSDLDLARGLLTIRPELGKTRQERRGRVVPVSPHLVELVSGWGRREGLIAGRAPDGGCPRSPWVRECWEKAGYSSEQIPQPSHAMRHGVRHELTIARVREVVINHLIGHELGIGAGTYADASVALMEEAREAVALIPRIGESPAAVVVSLDARRKP